MRRIFLILGAIILLVAGVFGYQHFSVKSKDQQRQMFDLVTSEKMQQLYEQAQDWSRPIQLNVQDRRLQGDYKILSEFSLNFWYQNAERRNQYLRELKAAQWDQFLNVSRLDADRQSGFKATEQMLKTAHRVTESYQQDSMKIKQQALQQVAQLKIADELRLPLQEKLQRNLQMNNKNALILLEIQILNHDDDMFTLLKKYEWEKKDEQILFKNDAQVKQFNALYASVLKLTAEIEQRKDGNAEALEGAID